MERRYPPERAQYLSPVEEEEVRHMLTSSMPVKEGIGPEAHWILMSFKPYWKNVTIVLCLEVEYVICYIVGALHIQDQLTV